MRYEASAAALSTSSSNTLPCSGHFQWKRKSKVTVETSPGEKTSPQRSLKIILHLRNQQRESHYLSLDHSRIHCFVAQVNSGSVSPGLLGGCGHLDGPEELLFGYRGRLFAFQGSQKVSKEPPVCLPVTISLGLCTYGHRSSVLCNPQRILVIYP